MICQWQWSMIFKLCIVEFEGYLRGPSGDDIRVSEVRRRQNRKPYSARELFYISGFYQVLEWHTADMDWLVCHFR